MKSFADVKRRFAIGVRLECVENTYRPELDGSRRTINKVQTNAIRWREDGSDQQCWTPYPAASGVKIVDGDTFDMPLRQGQHYVRLRFLKG
jgi:hypothetical protein